MLSPKSGAGSVAASSEERLEQMSQNFLAHTAAVIFDDDDGRPFVPIVDSNVRLLHRFHAFQCVGDQIQNDLPISCGLTWATTSRLDMGAHRFAAVLADLADHRHDIIAPSSTDVGRARVELRSSRLKSSSFSVMPLQRYASSSIRRRLLVSALGEFGVDCSLIGAASGNLADSRFQRFGTPGDRCQRIVDLVSDAGRQEPDAGQLFVLDHLTGSLANLAIQVGTPRVDLRTAP